MDSFECINYNKLGVRHVFFREEKLDWYDNANVFNLLFVSNGITIRIRGPRTPSEMNDS